MAVTNNKTQIKVALISFCALIISAIIGWHPWTQKINTDLPINPIYFAGTVVDEKSNRSISQAEITVVGRNDHYSTEGNGNFRIPISGKNVKDIRIRVVKNGFLPYDRTYDLPNESVIILLEKDK